MMNRAVAGLVVTLAFTGALPAEETRGGVIKVEDGSITIRTIVVGFSNGKSVGKPEEKMFKVGKDVKVLRLGGQGMRDVPLTLADLATAVKVTKVSVRITHDGANGSVIKVLPAGLGG